MDNNSMKDKDLVDLDHDPDLVRKNVNKIVKKRNISVQYILDILGETRANFNKSYKSKNFPYAKRTYHIAKILECSIDDILGSSIYDILGFKPKYDISKNEINQVGEQNKNYETRIDRNNFFSDPKDKCLLLKSENEHLKQLLEKQEQMIEKQDKEIAFLRDQLKHTLKQP